MTENNFQNNTIQPFTVFMNDFIQKETIFKKASTKLTYMYLYSLKNCSSIFPSLKTIAVATCTSISTIQRTLEELEKLGLLEIHPRPGYTSIYILNDYYQVIQNKVGQNEQGPKEPDSTGQNDQGQNEQGTQVKMTTPPGQNDLLKLKDKNKTIKNKISSRESIDNLLKESFPNAPFEQVKEQMINDETLTIHTDKQYKSMLEYRLKNWKPVTKKNKKFVRTESVPEWMDKNDQEEVIEPKYSPEEIEKKKSLIEERLSSLRNR
jgi:hypothetical protein